MSKQRSHDLHEITELVGQQLSLDTLEIIRFRYDWAARAIAGKRALEIGCGAGIGLTYFSRVASYFVGGDYSEENLRLCVERHGSPALVRFDAHFLPFSDESFDVVVALAMVYYLKMEAHIAEVARVLRRGGSFLFCTSNKDVSGFVPAPHTVRYYSIPELANLLDAAGFDAQFCGAFPSAGGSIALSMLRGVVKNIIKVVIGLLPGGHRAWATMRLKAEGARSVLPEDVRDLPEPKAQPMMLSPDKVNRLYRVIYVTAHKRAT